MHFLSTPSASSGILPKSSILSKSTSTNKTLNAYSFLLYLYLWCSKEMVPEPKPIPSQSIAQPQPFLFFLIPNALIHRSLWYLFMGCSLFFGGLLSSKVERTWYHLGPLFTSVKTEAQREVTSLTLLEKLVMVMKSELSCPDSYPKLQSFPTSPSW